MTGKQQIGAQPRQPTRTLFALCPIFGEGANGQAQACDAAKWDDIHHRIAAEENAVRFSPECDMSRRMSGTVNDL